MRYLPLLTAAILLAGCGTSQATPPGDNPLLANGVSRIQLYEWIHEANQTLDKNANGHSKMCVTYEVKRAKAKALPEKLRQKVKSKMSDKTEETCADYEQTIAPMIANSSGLDVSAADMKTPEVWTKFNKGRVAHVFERNPKKHKTSDKAKKHFNDFFDN